VALTAAEALQPVTLHRLLTQGAVPVSPGRHEPLSQPDLRHLLRKVTTAGPHLLPIVTPGSDHESFHFQEGNSAYPSTACSCVITHGGVYFSDFDGALSIWFVKHVNSGQIERLLYQAAGQVGASIPAAECSQVCSKLLKMHTQFHTIRCYRLRSQTGGSLRTLPSPSLVTIGSPFLCSSHLYHFAPSAPIVCFHRF